MKIHNDFLSLDQEMKVIQKELEELTNIRKQLTEQINSLYSNGFKDSKFTELKTAVEKSGNTITEFNKSMQLALVELQNRSQLIKQYYAVKL
jgi:seryl-tRNA synthetase